MSSYKILVYVLSVHDQYDLVKAWTLVKIILMIQGDMASSHKTNSRSTQIHTKHIFVTVEQCWHTVLIWSTKSLTYTHAAFPHTLHSLSVWESASNCVSLGSAISKSPSLNSGVWSPDVAKSYLHRAVSCIYIWCVFKCFLSNKYKLGIQLLANC